MLSIAVRWTPAILGNKSMPFRTVVQLKTVQWAGTGVELATHTSIVGWQASILCGLRPRAALLLNSTHPKAKCCLHSFLDATVLKVGRQQQQTQQLDIDSFLITSLHVRRFSGL